MLIPVKLSKVIKVDNETRTINKTVFFHKDSVYFRICKELDESESSSSKVNDSNRRK